MKPILTAQQMRDMERAYFDAGAASIDLMERAAAALCDELLHALAGRGKTCVFACGTGGNGGDGYAAARLFAEKGGRAIILPVGQPRTTDAIRNCERARGAVFAFADVRGLDAIPRPDAWADCLFGIGLSRAPEGDAARVIERMNADRLAGQTAIVTETIDACADTGAVRVSGVLWTAKCATGERIEKGRHVTIERVEGAKLYVKPAEMPCEKA